MWNAITYPWLRYLLLAPMSLYIPDSLAADRFLSLTSWANKSIFSSPKSPSSRWHSWKPFYILINSTTNSTMYGVAMAWKLFPHYYPFMMGINRTLVHPLHKGLVMPMFLDWGRYQTNNWVTNDIRVSLWHHCKGRVRCWWTFQMYISSVVFNQY